MKLAALTFVGLGLIGAAQAQVQTNPVREQQYLPVPETMPELPVDTGMSAIDAVMFSETMRGSVRDDSATPPAPAAVVQAEEPLTPSGEPAITNATAPAAQPSPQTVAVQSPTVLLPEEQAPKPGETPEEAKEEPAEAAPQVARQVINVIVEGVESSNGTINVGVCDKALSKEGCPYSTEVKASAGFVEAQFEGIPPGRYAVVGYHDVNGNSEHDKNFLGVPKEPYALSNNAGSQMIPTFKDAAVNIKPGETTVIITMRRFGGG